MRETLLRLGAIRPLPPLCPWEQPLSRTRPYLRLVVNHERDDSGRAVADLDNHRTTTVSVARRRRVFRVLPRPRRIRA
jgi:hypothetical protein